MSDLFGYVSQPAPFKDIPNTRESVAEEKARLCMELNQLLQTPPPFASNGIHSRCARMEARTQAGAQGAAEQTQLATGVEFRNHNHA